MLNFDLVKAAQSEQLFRPFLHGGLESWSSWITFFKVLSGYKELEPDEMALFRECTGLEELPSTEIKECFLVIGRRGGKSSVTALLAVAYALWGDWSKHRAPGEEIFIFVIATNKAQGKIILRYISAILDLPQFSGIEKRILAEEIIFEDLGVTISVKPASFRSSRGFTIGFCALDELAYFRFMADSETCDKEIYAAIKPGMTTVSNSLLVGLSTPFARQGLLWEKFDRHYGKPGPVLIWKAPTWIMHRGLLKEDLERDFLGHLTEAEFGAEYAAEWRDDIESYLPAEVIDSAVDQGVIQRPAEDGIAYVGFCDPSEGLRRGGDSMTFAVAHEEGEMIFLDALIEFQPPFKPIEVIKQIAEVCQEYGIEEISQDRHAIAWIANDFLQHNIYVKVAANTKSEIYQKFGVAMSKGNIRLLDNDRLRNQFLGLQRYLRSGGIAKIDSRPGGHEDAANAAAGAAVLLIDRVRFDADQCFVC